MLFREMVAIYFQNRTECIKKSYGQNGELFDVVGPTCISRVFAIDNVSVLSALLRHLYAHLELSEKLHWAFLAAEGDIIHL
jgi:hypothetical protein